MIGASLRRALGDGLRSLAWFDAWCRLPRCGLSRGGLLRNVQVIGALWTTAKCAVTSYIVAFWTTAMSSITACILDYCDQFNHFVHFGLLRSVQSLRALWTTAKSSTLLALWTTAKSAITSCIVRITRVDVWFRDYLHINFCITICLSRVQLADDIDMRKHIVLVHQFKLWTIQCDSHVQFRRSVGD